jgi:hypothetical protein
MMGLYRTALSLSTPHRKFLAFMCKALEGTIVEDDITMLYIFYDSAWERKHTENAGQQPDLPIIALR